MSFVTTGLAVAGIVSIAVPIVIFLLWRQRRTPVPWAAMRFLVEAFRKHRRRLQVEQLLLLLVRCLILALLGLALGRPLLEGMGLLGGSGARTVYVVIDDGLVSGVESEPGAPALADHIAAAVEIVEGLDAGDRVGLITCSRPARALLHPPSTDHGAVVGLLRSLRPRSAPTDLPGAMQRLEVVLEDLDSDHGQVFCYLFSDFRAGSAELDTALPSTLPADIGAGAGRIALLAASPAADPIANVQITAIEPARRFVLAGALDGSGQVTIRLARQGGELDREVSRVRLEVEGLGLIEPKVVEWAPGQSEASTDFLIDLPPKRERETGITVGIDGDALAADDVRHTVLTLRKNVRALLIDRLPFGAATALDRLAAGQWIARALAPTPDGPVEIVTVEPAALEIADLRTADVAILPRPDLLPDPGWALVRRFVDAGGLLLVSPPGDLLVHRWTDQLSAALGLGWSLTREARELSEPLVLAAEQPVSALLRMISSDLADLGRPVRVTRLLSVDEPPAANEVVLRLADGTPLLLAGTPAADDANDSQTGPDAAAGGQVRQPRGGAGRGLVLYLACAPVLEWTDLPSKPMMVPLYHEMVRQGLSVIRDGSSVAAGGRPPVFAGPAARALITPDGELLPLDAAGRPERELEQTGLYAVVDAAAQPIGALAVNVEPGAGRTDPQPATGVEAWLGRSGRWEFLDADDLGVELRRAEGGSPLAGALLMAVLALVALETMLARWFSHAAVPGPGGRTRGLQPMMGTARGGPGGAV